MRKLNSTAIIYYTGAVLISVAFCLALLATLNWPLLAEIPLGISIFIQLVAISRSIFTFVEKTREETIMKVYSRLKGGVFDTEVKEKASYTEH